MRSSLEIPLEGPRTENAFVIVDTAEDADAPLPVERVFHYEHPAVDGRNVLFVPFAGHWRVDLQCRPDDDAEAFSGTAGVARWLPEVMDAKYAERVTWVSTYVFLQVLAREFVDPERRVLLVGEAAHLFAPFGARGLNSGIPDAIVAARAIRSALDAAIAGRGSSGRGPLRGLAASSRSPEPRGLEHRPRAPLSARSPSPNAPSRSRARGAPRHARPDAGSTRRRTDRGSGRRTPTGCSTRRIRREQAPSSSRSIARLRIFPVGPFGSSATRTT